MAESFEFHFEWDAAKAASNQRKHGVSFDLAATIFRDPLIISIPDEEHSETEERWVTLGQTENSKLLLIVHTYLEISANAANVRIISARAATKHEQRQYEADT
ncbi:MAG: BrnT family toxin [Sedimenticola sp.]